MTEADRMHQEYERRREAELADCDNPGCPAKQDPDESNLSEVLAAFHHWREHGYLLGCAHGR